MRSTEQAGAPPAEIASPVRLPRLREISVRTRFLLAGVIAILLLLVLPPLLSLSRYQHRITTSMSQVLGRPVHLDRVTLNLLPLPSFTIENLVIEEAPAFGAEPIIRANSVSARLRVSSLWRRRVEFSRITFIDPSVNLVRNPDGRWNLESVLLQAAHIDTAPTSQRSAGDAPRFPYIEATGARVNLKLGSVKTPFSLTDADFALWLPKPSAWKMRIRAHPARTDTSASDTGAFQLEATLNRAAAMAEVPIDLDASWRDAPLGETSRVLDGTDAGLRGQMTLTTHLHGVLSAADLTARLTLASLHRADFVPEHSVSVDLSCTARALALFRTLDELRCSWPVPDSQDSAAGSKGAIVALSGTLPDVLSPGSAQLQIGTANLPAAVLLTWLRVLSPRVPPTLTAPSGLLRATLAFTGGQAPPQGIATLTGLTLAGAAIGETPATFGPVTLTTAPPSLPMADTPTQHATLPDVLLEPLSFPADPAAPPAASALRTTGPAAPPAAFPVRAADPAAPRAAALLDGQLNHEGYSLHLTGTVFLPHLLAIAGSVPQLGDGLFRVLPRGHAFTGPVRLDLTAHRHWGAAQLWTDNLSTPAPVPRVPTHPR